MQGVHEMEPCLLTAPHGDDEVLADPGHVPHQTVAEIWLAAQPSDAEIRQARRRLHAKALFISALVIVSYWVLVISDVTLALRIVAACSLVIALVALATGVMHDANHGSFSSKPWLNRMASLTSDALGASSWLWRVQHNLLHHGNTNVEGHDADLELAPFARLAPTQPWHWWYRAQHIYIWPLYGFLTIKNLLVSDFVAIIRRKIGQRTVRQPIRPRVIAGVALGKVSHIGWAFVLPLFFNPWQAVLIFYLAASWVVGFILAVTFQLAHCVDIASVHGPQVDRRGESFVHHQLDTTVNVACKAPVFDKFFRWLVGGLDHQIEHHLAPRLPHTIHAKVARRFQAGCALHHIDYHLHPSLAAALRSHQRWLHTMSHRQSGAAA